MSRLRFIPPQLPSLTDQPPEGANWIHEVKHDGYRTMLLVERGTALAYTRNGHDWSDRYPGIIAAARKLPCRSAILDGEVIVQDARGISDFEALQAALRSRPAHLIFYAFDLLHLDGKDLLDRPLVERRAKLLELMSRDQGSAIQFSEEFVGDAAAFCRACAAHELEGIVSKLANSRYRSGRSRTWLKTKCFAESELTLLGIDRDRKTGAQRALLAKSERGQLIYAGPAFIALRGEPREDFEARVAATTGLRDFAPNSASARGVRGISRERHSRHRKAHMHILFECRSKCVPTGNADQHWCSLSVGLPIGFAAAKIYAARLERIRPRTQRLTVLEVQ